MVAKKYYYVAGAGLLLYLVTATANKAFAFITANMKFRGSDAFGSGAFAASRSGGTRGHNGVDVVTTVGQAILSPITGQVTRIAYPYSDDKRYTGLEIVNSDYKVKLFYVSPTVVIGTPVKAGQKIAIAQNIAAKYGTGMINHVHIEAYDKKGNLLNPTNLF